MYNENLGKVTLVRPWETVIILSEKCKQAICLFVSDSKNAIYGFKYWNFETADVEAIKKEILFAGLPGDFIIDNIDDGHEPCFISEYEDLTAGVSAYIDEKALLPTIQLGIIKLKSFLANKKKKLEQNNEQELGM